MPSSTSSSEAFSEQALPDGSVTRPLLAAVTVFLLVLVIFESALAWRGFVPTIVDDQSAWIRERQRVHDHPDAVLVIGSSRAQLGIDLAVLAHAYRRPVVQLAIDGASFLPVLSGLATDSEFRGTVIVDYTERSFEEQRKLIPAHWERAAALRPPGFLASPSVWMEARLDGLRRLYSRLHADGARPWRNVLGRVLNPEAMPQYLVTLPDRQRLADYSVLDVEGFALRTAARHLEIPLEPSFDLAERIEAAIMALVPADEQTVRRDIESLASDVEAIEARGGRVTLVRLPSSGYIARAEERRFPRAISFSLLEGRLPGRTLHFEDDPGLRAFACPDGSHLDRRDRSAFTHALIKALERSSVVGLADR